MTRSHSSELLRPGSRSTPLLLGTLTILAMSAGEIGRGAEPGAMVPVGVAQVDITPDRPIRLTGYGNRKTASEGVELPIKAKALAIGGDAAAEAGPAAGPVVLVTVDNCGVPGTVTEEVARRLKVKLGLPRERFVVSSSHTHCAPALAGVLPFIFGVEISASEQARIAAYTRELTDKIEQVARAALAGRRSARLSWDQGWAGFAHNRRQQGAKGVAIGVNPAGPVDQTLPMLCLRNPDGGLRAVVVNYACHCTAIGGDFNKICGDWAGYACHDIERDHPGAIALVTIGCGADANPNPRGTLQTAQDHGAEIAREADRLIREPGKPLAPSVEARLKRIELPFGPLPSRSDWEERAKRPGAEGLLARTNLARLDRGETIPKTLPYVVQTWTFGNDLAMVFLAGEVVVDYARRLKTECDDTRLWISAYCNDVPCYIASRRVIGEGGYEVDRSMDYYGRPTRLDPEAEDRIITAVRELLPASFQPAPAAKK